MRHGPYQGEEGYSTRCQGFTLVELLVVITIIGMLMAILLPAVQAAREAARRMQCGNNLKQLGVGFHNFESANGGFPPRRWNRNADADGNGGNGYTGWGTFLLPFIEQQNLYDAYNWNYDFFDPVNKAVVETKLPVFICPCTTRAEGEYITCASAASAGSANPNKGTTYTVKGWIDYLAPNGFTTPTGPASSWIKDFPGYTSANTTSNAHQAMLDSCPGQTGFANVLTRAPRPLGEIKDGLSNTLLIAETAGWPHQFQGRQREPVADCDPSNSATNLGTRGSWAGFQSFVYYTYSADGALNSGSSPGNAQGDLVACAVNCYNRMQPYSFHPGGVYVLFCDGSVRFVAETVSAVAYGQITIIDDGQAITDGAVQP